MHASRQSLQANDAVIAVGQLKLEGDQLYFHARGEGACDEDLQTSRTRLPVRDLKEPGAPTGKKITIRAIWSGTFLDDVAVVSDCAGPAYPNEKFESPNFSLPAGRTEKALVFTQEFIDATEAAYDDVLVGILAYPLPDGWVGIISKRRNGNLPATLQEQIKPWHVLTESPWGHRHITELNDLLTDPATEGVQAFGSYWDSSGLYRVFFLVPYLASEMAAALSRFPGDMYRVISWIEKAK